MFAPEFVLGLSFCAALGIYGEWWEGGSLLMGKKVRVYIQRFSRPLRLTALQCWKRWGKVMGGHRVKIEDI